MDKKELSNIEVIYLIQELGRLEKAKALKEKRTEIFNQIPGEFKIKICLGCQGDYADCDCPAGSSERLRSNSEIEGILQLRVSRLNKGDMMYKIAEPTRGFMAHMAYPQYKGDYSQRDIISVHTWVQLQQYVQEKMNDKVFGPNPEVREHMIKILDGIVPFGMRIVGEVN